MKENKADTQRQGVETSNEALWYVVVVVVEKLIRVSKFSTHITNRHRTDLELSQESVSKS